MNWLVAFGSLCSFGTLVTVARFVFVAGTYKQRFIDSEKRAEEHDVRLGGHDGHLARHDIAIATINARSRIGTLHATGK